ncbi:MAG: hypothetical protein ACI924_001993 [Flavobacterium sp.]|jgi:uncharacterized protein YkwD
MNAKKINLYSLAFIMSILLGFSSCISPEEANVNSVEIIQTYEYNEFELLTLKLINDYRVSIGLNTIEPISHISSLCSDHNNYMISSNVVGHDNFAQRQQNLHLTLGALKVGENVAFNFDDCSLLVEAWINSPPHREKIEGDFTHFGISVSQNELNQKFYTNIFIKK